MAGSANDPSRIERVGDDALRIHWGDGHDSLYTWEFLRASCPCALCREIPSPDPSPPLGGEGRERGKSVYPVEIKPVGRYALAIRWSDGHTTGIFSHDYLRSICSCEACRPNQMTEG